MVFRHIDSLFNIINHLFLGPTFLIIKRTLRWSAVSGFFHLLVISLSRSWNQLLPLSSLEYLAVPLNMYKDDHLTIKPASILPDLHISYTSIIIFVTVYATQTAKNNLFKWHSHCPFSQWGDDAEETSETIVWRKRPIVVLRELCTRTVTLCRWIGEFGNCPKGI